LQTKYVQNYVAGLITNYLEKNINTRIDVDNVEITFFNSATLNNIYIEDLHNDTLLFAKEISLRSNNILKPVFFKSHKLRIRRIFLDSAFIHFATDSSGVSNLNHFIGLLKRDKKVKKNKKPPLIKKITLVNSKIRISKFSTEEPPAGINFKDLRVHIIHSEITDLSPLNDSVRFQVANMKFIEASGFRVKELNTEVCISNSGMNFENVFIITDRSSVISDYIRMKYDNIKDFKNQGINDKIDLGIKISSSQLNLYDLAYFAPALAKSNQPVNFSGTVSGRINNLKAKNVYLKFGRQSTLSGDISLTGLPDINETFMVFNLNSLITNTRDIGNLKLPGNKSITIPDWLHKTGRLAYTGNFTGFIDDFVTYGTLQTGIGKVSTDILFKPDTDNFFRFNGNLKMDQFDIGRLLDTETIGKITLSVSIDGSSQSVNTIDADMNGTVASFEINDYNYKNIQLSGELTNQTYDGSITMQDPNINLEFLGRVDISKETAEYNFFADVKHADLHALNIDKLDSTHSANFKIIANATGNSLETLNGEISLLDSRFNKHDKNIRVRDATVTARNTVDSSSFKIRSDIIDLDMKGSYKMDKIKDSFFAFLSNYAPAFSDTTVNTDNDFNNDFILSVEFKNTDEFFNYFFPDYILASGSILKSNYNIEKKRFTLFFQSPLVNLKNIAWSNMYINTEANDSIFSLESGSKKLVVADRIPMENFSVYSIAYSDTCDLKFRWNNWDSAAYSGNIVTKAFFSKNKETSNNKILFEIFPSKVITEDTLWNIEPSFVQIDSSSIKVNNFQVNHDNQFLNISGTLSKRPEDDMVINFGKFNIANINTITRPSGFEFKGIVNGEATLSDIFNNTLFNTRIKIEDFTINNEFLGNTNIDSRWNNTDRSIEIDAGATRGKLKVLALNGKYYPFDDNRLSFDIKLDKLRLDMLDRYAVKLLTNPKGFASGDILLAGTTANPLLNGELHLQKAIFTVNFLNSRYSFSERIKINNNTIIIDNLVLYDKDGNMSRANGTVHADHLKNISFSIRLNADNFLFLNTSLSNNNQYYGTAYATGIVELQGTPKNVNLDIKAKTERNTRFFIPLNRGGTTSEYNFVTFYQSDTSLNTERYTRNYNLDMSGIQLNFDLEITPDAEVQIIFDPKVGDIIKTRGYGDLNLAINTNGEFSMMGEYDIVNGDYLFTLQDVINKKLKVESGSKLTWNGDPLDAILDVNAYYRTKASLYDLLGDESYKNRTTVDCRLNLTGKLANPEIKYDIFLPYAEDDTRQRVIGAITTDEETSKQFLSLLVLNSFLPNNNLLVNNPSYQASGTPSNAAGVNASELLSNQLSNWLSQISNDFDIGINYRPGYAITSNEVEFALSTQLLNDRLSINGNIDVNTNATATRTNNIVGDFDMDYKLNKSGKLRVKAFNRANDDIIYENSPYTQGVGLFYKEEFNTFGELLKRYWEKLTGKNRKDKTDKGLSQTYTK